MLAILKTGTKLVGVSMLMGAGAEIAGHISSKGQVVNEGSQYVMIEDLGTPISPDLIQSMPPLVDQAHVGTQA